MRSEEEMYELRRQEELRRQIEAKERELEAMSLKNRERINKQHSFNEVPNRSSSSHYNQQQSSG